MSGLSALRAHLADTIADGDELRCFDHVPQPLTPPLALVEPDDPWLSDEPEGVPFGSWLAAYRVVLIAGRAPNDTAMSALDVLLSGVLDRIADSDTWDLATVEAPGQVADPAGNKYPGVVLTVTTITDLS